MPAGGSAAHQKLEALIIVHLCLHESSWFFRPPYIYCHLILVMARTDSFALRGIAITERALPATIAIRVAHRIAAAVPRYMCGVDCAIWYHSLKTTKKDNQ